ncbi:rhodanese-like domain-containing protein [Paenibacillus sp. S33]|uniref:rhodanese-like domain-containing protein n=1 Tax=Paenibacillus polymyxa TaxID=1406 RepID=UPI0039FC57EB
MKILDVRDVSKYSTGHIPSSLNISFGRLPLVWSKNLAPNDKVIIFSSSLVQRKSCSNFGVWRVSSLYVVKGYYLSMTSRVSWNYHHKEGYCK